MKNSKSKLFQQMQPLLESTFSCFTRDELQKEGGLAEKLIQAIAFREKQYEQTFSGNAGKSRKCVFVFYSRRASKRGGGGGKIDPGN